MKKYKYILMDVDDTLLDFQKSERTAMSRAFEMFELDVKGVSRLSEINRNLWQMLEKGEITRETLKKRRFEIYFEEIGVKDIPINEISKAYVEYLSECSYTFTFAENVCKRLVESGRVIYIITNGTEKVQTMRMKNSPVKDYITKSFISDAIGYSKPSKEFFDYVINDLKISRKDALIIGDSLTSDILGGINSGIDTCWFNQSGKENTKNIVPTYTVSNLEDIFGIIGE